MNPEDIKGVQDAAGMLLKTIQKYLGVRCVVAFGVVEQVGDEERILASEWHSGGLKPGDVEKLALNINGALYNLANKGKRRL